MITCKHSISLKMWNFQDDEKVAQAHTVRKGHRQDLNQVSGIPQSWLLTANVETEGVFMIQRGLAVGQVLKRNSLNIGI